MKKLIFIIPAIAAVLTGCATAPSVNSYTSSSAEMPQHVALGVVLSVRHIMIRPGTSGMTAGGAAGGLGGAALGSQVGHGVGKLLAEVAGGLGGWLAGSHLEAMHGERKGELVTVRLDHAQRGFGDLVAIPEAGRSFARGERVEIIGSARSGRARVLPY